MSEIQAETGERRGPYRGLVPYQEEDEPYFFGRGSETRLVVASLFAAPITLLYGESGVGKSSLLRAGVLPQLRSREGLRVVLFNTWQDRPLEHLKRSLVQAAAHGEVQEEEAGMTNQSLADLVRRLLTPEWRRVMVLLDQFEEYFVYPQQEGLASELGELVLEAELPVGVLISIREDYLGRLDAFGAEIPPLFENLLRVDHLSRQAGREAIKQPIARYNSLVEKKRPFEIEPALVDEVLDQVAVEKLGPERAAGVRAGSKSRTDAIETPYLQLVMQRIFAEELRAGSRKLRLAMFVDELGGAGQIVDDHLNQRMARFRSDQLEAAARIFRFLVTPSGSKIAYSASDLAALSGSDETLVTQVLDSLSAGENRILRPIAAVPGKPATSRYEIFHDVLAPAILAWRKHYLEAASARLATRDRGEPMGLAGPASGIALCLSGGGYRTMLFQVGVLWRLNELGYLPRLDRVSSVSGASITTAVLGMRWSALEFGGEGVASNLRDLVVEPIRSLAGRTIDVAATFLGMLPGVRTADWYARAYRRHLFGRRTLQDLPDRPEFFLSATNLQSGVLWRFSKRYMWDWRVGQIKNPETELAVAVSASTAILGPVRLRLKDSDFVPGSGANLQRPPYTTKVILADGALYDNLALEVAWKGYSTILVSDGSKGFGFEEAPEEGVGMIFFRFLDVAQQQNHALRTRELVSAYQAGERQGAYWGINTKIANYRVTDALSCSPEKVAALAAYPSRFAAVRGEIQERLINWGYAVCDAAVRSHVGPTSPPPAGFPYPAQGVG